MNHRLLTRREKAENRRGRNRRNALRQRHARRRNLLCLLHGECSAFLESELSPAEALQLLAGHGNSARRLQRRLVRSAVASFKNPAAPIGANALFPIDRPQRRLQRSRQGVVVDCVADARLLISLPAAIEPAIEVLHGTRTNCIKDVRILCSFVAATLLPWDLAANFLFARGVLSRQLSAGEITAAKRARDFWGRYDLGRRRYQAAVASEELLPAIGDWALFSPHNLFTLLPGIRIPIAFRRSEYATNLIQQNDKFELDVHSMPERLPLFCHALGQPTSPSRTVSAIGAAPQSKFSLARRKIPATRRASDFRVQPLLSHGKPPPASWQKPSELLNHIWDPDRAAEI